MPGPRFLVLAPFLAGRADHGGRMRSRMLLDALRACGAVTIAAPASEPDAAELRREGLTVEELPVVADADRGSLPRKLRAWSRGRSDVLTRRWSPAAHARAAELLAQRPDLLVVDGSHALPLVPVDDATPLALHLHNVEFAVLARRDAVRRGPVEALSRRVEARCMRALELRHAARARLTVTVSEVDAQHLRQRCPAAHVAVVPNAVDLRALPLLPPPAAAAAPLLLFVGSFDYPPNREAALELLREHLPVLRASHPDLRLRLVGRDDHGVIAAHARACAAEATGRVDDLLPHYQEATAVYLPIRSGGGTRIKVLEAMALGRPVLASAVAVEGLRLEHGAHYLRVERPADGVRALDRVLLGQAAELVKAARARVESDHGRGAAVDRLAGLMGAAADPSGGAAVG